MRMARHIYQYRMPSATIAYLLTLPSLGSFGCVWVGVRLNDISANAVV